MPLIKGVHTILAGDKKVSKHQTNVLPSSSHGIIFGNSVEGRLISWQCKKTLTPPPPPPLFIFLQLYNLRAHGHLGDVNGTTR